MERCFGYYRCLTLSFNAISQTCEHVLKEVASLLQANHSAKAATLLYLFHQATTEKRNN